MEARINNGKDSYLYCSVDIEVGKYYDFYNSSQECIEEVTPDIIAECIEKEYTEEETQRVVQHYSIIFNNAVGTWKNLYE